MFIVNQKISPFMVGHTAVHYQLFVASDAYYKRLKCEFTIIYTASQPAIATRA